jgi:phosphoribosyl 1,2-cyclic phosphodiesterase
MKVRFWGVRGSIPTPGRHTNRYGGNTSCVEVAPRTGDSIVVDAGTGLRLLGKNLMQSAHGEGKGNIHLLISHTHWDHIQGLPYFSPLYREGNKLFIYGRRRDDTHLKAVLSRQNEGPYFPVPMASMKAEVDFREVIEGETFQIGSAKISCTKLNHPWIAIAYRIDCDGASVVYCSDTAPFTDILLEQEFVRTPPQHGSTLSPRDAEKLLLMRTALVELCRDVDLLIYDTQFTPEEYATRPHWGHSTPDDAIQMARDCGAKCVALFHHAPLRTDDEQDAIVEMYRAKIRDDENIHLIAAYEGLEVELGEQP